MFLVLGQHDFKECQESHFVLGKGTTTRLAIRTPTLASGHRASVSFLVKCGRDTKDLQDAS